MRENERSMAEQVIESIDMVLGQLRSTPWAFRLESDGTLVSDPQCYYYRNADEENEEDYEEYEKKMQYQRRVWEEYGEIFSLSPFVLAEYEKVQEFTWLDIITMSWGEITETFLKEELALVRTILRSEGFGHMPVPEALSDEALNQLIAFRYKERLVYAMECDEINPTHSEIC